MDRRNSSVTGSISRRIDHRARSRAMILHCLRIYLRATGSSRAARDDFQRHSERCESVAPNVWFGVDDVCGESTFPSSPRPLWRRSIRTIRPVTAARILSREETQETQKKALLAPFLASLLDSYG